MKLFVKIKSVIKYLIPILLGATAIFVFCNRPIPFDKERWTQSGGFQGRHFIQDDLFVRGNTRYRMALWLERNYSFCDKSLSEILDKFYIEPECNPRIVVWDLEQVKNDRKLRVIKRQRNSWSIDPWIDINWIEIYFDENFMVSRVYYAEYNRRTGSTTRRKICGVEN